MCVLTLTACSPKPIVESLVLMMSPMASMLASKQRVHRYACAIAHVFVREYLQTLHFYMHTCALPLIAKYVKFPAGGGNEPLLLFGKPPSNLNHEVKLETARKGTAQVLV